MNTSRVAPVSPGTEDRADITFTGPPTDGRYVHQRFFGEESCFALAICWPASPIIAPLLLCCGLDTRTVWIGSDGSIWEVSLVDRSPVALARDAAPCSRNLPRARSPVCSLLPLSLARPPHPLARLTAATPPTPLQSADPGAKRVTSKLDVSGFGKGRRYQSGRIRPQSVREDSHGPAPASMDPS